MFGRVRAYCAEIACLRDPLHISGSDHGLAAILDRDLLIDMHDLDGLLTATANAVERQHALLKVPISRAAVLLARPASIKALVSLGKRR
jgi:hypothetical protein